MADTNGGSNGNPGGGKQSGLSWSQPLMPSQNNQATAPKPASAAGAQTQKPSTMQPIKAYSAPAQKTTMQSGGTSRIVGGFIGGLIIGALITTIWFTSAGSAAAPINTSDMTGAASSTDSSIAPGDMMLPSTALSIATPQGAGSQVVVDSATVSAPTWLVVYETANGQPVRILGASMIFPENNGKGATVPLLRATQPGETYVVGERLDDGDHKLSLTLDKPVSDSSGNALWSSFTTR